MAHPRPPLPPGPYLVVGLARSGVAAALALRAARPGERVVAVDSGRPAEALADAGRAGAGGRRSPPRIGWNPSLGGIAAASHARQEPRGPAGCARRRARAQSGTRGHRGAGARMAARAERVHRRDGHQRKDDDGRADRCDAPRGRRPRGRGRQRRHAGQLPRRHHRPGSDGRLRGVELPARGLDRVRARGRRVPELLGGPPRPPRDARRTTATRSCASSPTRTRPTSRS